MVSGDSISYSQREPAALAKCSSLTFCEIITHTHTHRQRFSMYVQTLNMMYFLFSVQIQLTISHIIDEKLCVCPQIVD